MGRSAHRDLREGATSTTVLKDPLIILFKNGSSLVIVLIPHQTEGSLEKNKFSNFFSFWIHISAVRAQLVICTHTMYLKEGVKGKLPGPGLFSVGDAPVPCSAGKGMDDSVEIIYC